MVVRDPRPVVGLGTSQPDLTVAPGVKVADLLASIREEFGRQAAPAPPAEELYALARVVTGHQRASSDVWPSFDELTEEQAITSFVAASLSRWDPEDEDYTEVPDLVREGFVQRGLADPSPTVLDTLARVALGFLRRRSTPQPEAAQVAATDWVVALYRAPVDDEASRLDG